MMIIKTISSFSRGWVGGHFVPFMRFASVLSLSLSHASMLTALTALSPKVLLM